MKQTRKFGQNVEVAYSDGLALVTFDRGVNRNAIDQDTLLALSDVTAWLDTSNDIHVVVLTGARDHFSAGIDLKDPKKWANADASLLERREMIARGAKLCRRWEELPQMTIAAIEGPAIGAAVALTLACDLRVAAQNSILHLPEIKIGLNMGWGTIPRLVSLIGPARTKRMIVLAEKLDMTTAETWGLVDFVSETGKAKELACSIANNMLEAPGAPIRMSKEAIEVNVSSNHRLGIYMDVDQSLVCQGSDEARRAREMFAAKFKKN